MQKTPVNAVGLTLSMSVPRLQPFDLQSPDFQSYSRSPSRSPSRRDNSASELLDPLLANLSPVSTLEALRATDAVAFEPGSRQNALSKSIADSSTSERALGIRAALVGKKLREWCDEVQGWNWPESKFEGLEVSTVGENGSQEDASGAPETGKDAAAADTTKGTDQQERPLTPMDIMHRHERTESIRDDMETLDVEELKAHVRGAHLQYSTEPASYQHLNDFTVIITATIMQALPYISRLNGMLDIWFVRILVLRRVPGFLERLEQTRAAVDSAWEATKSQTASAPAISSKLTQQEFSTMRSITQEYVTDLGQRLDAMLDALEGEEDRIPDHWIDSMEAVQADYEEWVSVAERQVAFNEWWAQVESRQPSPLPEKNEGQKVPEPEKQEEQKVEEPEKKEEQKVEELEKKEEQKVAETETKMEQPAVPGNAEVMIDSNGEASGAMKNVLQESNATQPSQEKPHTEGDASSTLLTNASEHEEGIQSLLPKESSVSVDHQETKPSDKSLAKDIEAAPSVAGDKEDSAVDLRSPNEIEGRSVLDDQDIVVDMEPKRDVPKVESSAFDHVHDSNTAEITNSELNEDLPTFVASPSSEMLRQVENNARTAQGQDLPLREASRSSLNRPPPLSIPDRKQESEDYEPRELSPPVSGSSSTFSESYQAQIMEAAPVQFYKTPTDEKGAFWQRELTSTDAVSRRSSQRTERSVHTIRESPRGSVDKSTLLTPQKSSLPMELIEPNHDGLKNVYPNLGSMYDPISRIKRASTASIEVVPRTELKSITISRSGSHSSASNRPRSGSHTSTSPRKRSGSHPSLSPRSPISRENSDDSVQKLSILEQVAHNQEDLDTSQVESSDPPSPLISSALRVQKKRAPTTQDQPNVTQTESQESIASSSQYDLPDFVPANTDLETVSEYFGDGGNPQRLQSIDDQLTARISSILTNIRARIRLTSGPEADAPEVKHRTTSLQPRAADVPSLSSRPTHSRSVTPSLTLAPAYSKTSRPKPQHADSNVKLYHLHQLGKEKPIKLHVRLVGELGERVMVRVGGGWADLGAYLKEYAHHHGRRSVSEAKYQIMGGGPTTNTSAPHPSGRTTPINGPDSPLLRPGSSLANRKVRRASGVSASSPYTPEKATRPQWNATPGSVDSTASSIRSSSRLSWVDDDEPLGLAGPKSRNVEISPKKQAWVDEMMGQARQVSSSSIEKRRPDLAEIGKVGSTRRVFLKSKAEE